MLNPSINNNLKTFVLILIFSFFSIFYLVVSYSIPVDGDGALHASTVKEMVEKKTIIDFHPYALVEKENLLPIFYPKLFYMISTITYIFIGEDTFHVIVPFFGLLTGLFAFLFVRKAFNDVITALVVTTVLLSSFGLIVNSVPVYRMETMISMLGFSSIYCIFQYIKDRTIGWFVCSIILYAACICTKQQAYIYAPIFILIILFKFNENLLRKLIFMFMFFVLSVLISAPILTQEFLATGTLFYPGVPHVGKIEEIIANKLNVRLYDVGTGWIKYAVGSNRIISLSEKFSQISNHLLFLDPLRNINFSLISPVLYLSFILGIYAFLKKNFLIFILFLTFQQVLLYIQPLDRYFLLSQILAALVVGCSYYALSTSKLQNLKLVRLAYLIFLLTYSIYNSSMLLYKSTYIPDWDWGKYVPGRLEAVEDTGKWIKHNTSADVVLITPRTHVYSYYSERRSLWINQLGGEEIYEYFLSNDVEKIHEFTKSYKESLIVIPKHWVVNKDVEGYWISFLEQETIDKLHNSTDIFEKVYDTKYAVIFKPIY